jgi:hypothetical protein
MRSHSLLTFGSAVAGLVLLTGGAAPRGYVVSGHTWAIKQVPYYINPSNGDVSQSAAIAAIEYGANGWAAQSNADISFYYMGTTNGSSIQNNGKNEVFFRPDSNGSTFANTYWWYDGTGHLVDADIEFWDGGFTFFTGTSGCSSGEYLEDASMHEFGHALGLQHSSVTTATMYPTLPKCSMTWRTLDPDDLAGVEALYPASGATSDTAPTVSITSPANSASFSDGTSVSLTGSASDAEDGSLTSRIVWASNLLGQIGVGGSVAAVLPLGTNTITASITDSGGMTTTKQIAVTIAATTSTSTSSSPISLSANGYKVKGLDKATLNWSGISTTAADVYRNGSKIASLSNTGSMTDNINRKGSGTYSYKVCNAGSSTCSATVSVVF